jgi:hypothetical protein
LYFRTLAYIFRINVSIFLISQMVQGRSDGFFQPEFTRNGFDKNRRALIMRTTRMQGPFQWIYGKF